MPAAIRDSITKQRYPLARWHHIKRSAKMKSHVLALVIGSIAALGSAAIPEAEDPFGGSGESASTEWKPRPVTDEGKKTLEILRAEKLDLIELDPENPRKGFEIIKAKLEKRGVTVRFKNYFPDSKHRPGGPLPLRNVPLDQLMKYFDQWAGWGWILYPDGSITYFDNQCACAWPKDGLYCHDAQYEAGKPEKMEEERKAALETQKAEQAAPSGGDKPSK